MSIEMAAFLVLFSMKKRPFLRSKPEPAGKNQSGVRKGMSIQRDTLLERKELTYAINHIVAFLVAGFSEGHSIRRNTCAPAAPSRS